MSTADQIRYLDNEPGPLDADVDEAGSRGVADLAQVRRRSTRLSEALSALDPTDEEIRRSAEAIRPLLLRQGRHRFDWRGFPPAYRVAAVLAIVFGIAMTVEPARAWVIERLRAAVEAIAGTEPLPAPELDATRLGTSADLQLTVPAEGDSLRVEIVAGMAELVVRRVQGSATHIRVVGATGANLTSLSNGVRIDGGSTRSAVVEVEIPPTVAAVIVIGPEGSRSLHRIGPSDTEVRVRIGDH